ncbi:MAG: hypothetical protein KAI24_00770 [Planctomycetes bacterium]|nr:hypothetical protein [Planctomycetota bacterium]
MNTIRTRLVASVALAVAAAGWSPTPQAPVKLPGPTVSFRGEHSKVTERRYVRVRDAEAWAKLWCEHVGAEVPERDYHWHINAAKVPVVDFAQCEVVAVFGGNAPNNAGYFVEEVLDGETCTLRFDALTYQTSSDGSERGLRIRRSSPFGLFVISRTDKQIVLEENVQNLINQPPKWQARKTL